MTSLTFIRCFFCVLTLRTLWQMMKLHTKPCSKPGNSPYQPFRQINWQPFFGFLTCCFKFMKDSSFWPDKLVSFDRREIESNFDLFFNSESTGTTEAIPSKNKTKVFLISFSQEIFDSSNAFIGPYWCSTYIVHGHGVSFGGYKV